MDWGGMAGAAVLFISCALCLTEIKPRPSYWQRLGCYITCITVLLFLSIERNYRVWITHIRTCWYIYTTGLKFKEETSEVLHLEHRCLWWWNLDTSDRRSEIWKVLKFGTGEGWRRSVGPIVWEMKKYYSHTHTNKQTHKIFMCDQGRMLFTN